MKKDLMEQSTHATRYGALLIGAPEEIQMPEDFYYANGDRAQVRPENVTWEGMCERLYVELFRQKVNEGLFKIAKLTATAALVVLLAIWGYKLMHIGDSLKALSGPPTAVSTNANDPAVQQQLQNLSPEQRKALGLGDAPAPAKKKGWFGF